MIPDTAQKAARLLSSIRRLEIVIEELKNERAAKQTGLDFRCPGPQRHVLEVIDRRWDALGEWCVDFFITAMDAINRDAFQLANRWHNEIRADLLDPNKTKGIPAAINALCRKI